MKYVKIPVLDPWNRKRREMKEWCSKNLGAATSETSTRHLWFSRTLVRKAPLSVGVKMLKHYTVFYFQNEQHAVLFSLRWL